MIGWVVYQLVIKGKKWNTVKADALTCSVFATVWIIIAYLVSN